MKPITTEKVSVILDLVYYNATHNNQVCLSELAKKAKISYNPFRAIVKHLQDMNLLYIEGSNRKPTFRWNTEKSGVTTAMVRRVHDMYTGKTSSPVVPVTKKPKINTEICVKYLTEKGWSGFLTRTHVEGLIQVREKIVVGVKED